MKREAKTEAANLTKSKYGLHAYEPILDDNMIYIGLLNFTE